MPESVVGLYAFWYRPTGRCIYIGKAKDQPIKKRLYNHWRGVSSNDTLQLWLKAFASHMDFCYISVKQDYIDRWERRLIRRWHPEANKQFKEY